MIILRPNTVSFAGTDWPRVERLAIDRVAAKTVREWSEHGPYPTLVDVPEHLVRVRIVQAFDQTEMTSPRPGDLGQLRVELTRGGDEGRRLVRIDAVVESVTHDIGPKQALRTITLTAQSSAGSADPVLITNAS
ncbi:MAG: hypothetical protein LAT64_13120 [Phycisphaerales bacterium]|nr:hypothetical protein [Planctomycetota bacterium]MCH8509696.1 hypothetical protein [Phycisphaerales bacterium]